MILDFRHKLVGINEILFGQTLRAGGEKFRGNILQGSERRGHLHRTGQALRWQSQDGFRKKEPHVLGLQAGGEPAVVIVEKLVQPRSAGQWSMDEFVDVGDCLTAFGR
ncbi:MAG: hypothetical protein K9N47_23590 [Prosthecobacter sp.]|uniref:hypothetical protein n=1 Tax=Prosthecobacter sp. TaxID=1965333 RepID=UPI002610E775|nr:hypothetical protein [Prosthecobacter sp.]MCF7789128.1 hypothetical protein [Prosthecobacter sp.]